MKKATLNDLIGISERVDINKLTNVDIEKQVQDLTVKDLSDIALILINTVFGQHQMEQQVLSASAIQILTERAVKIKKEIL